VCETTVKKRFLVQRHISTHDPDTIDATGDQRHTNRGPILSQTASSTTVTRQTAFNNGLETFLGPKTSLGPNTFSVQTQASQRTTCPPNKSPDQLPIKESQPTSSTPVIRQASLIHGEVTFLGPNTFLGPKTFLGTNY
jgi:hypothetical protein